MQAILLDALNMNYPNSRKKVILWLKNWKLSLLDTISKVYGWKVLAYKCGIVNGQVFSTDREQSISLTFTCPKSTTEKLKKGVKYVQS